LPNILAIFDILPGEQGSAIGCDNLIGNRRGKAVNFFAVVKQNGKRDGRYGY
jgi:hypothetical protein